MHWALRYVLQTQLERKNVNEKPGAQDYPSCPKGLKDFKYNLGYCGKKVIIFSLDNSYIWIPETDLG